MREEGRERKIKGKEEIMTSIFFQENTDGWMIIISSENNWKRTSLCFTINDVEYLV